jgi:hypothetical protein
VLASVVAKAAENADSTLLAAMSTVAAINPTGPETAGELLVTRPT